MDRPRDYVQTSSTKRLQREINIIEELFEHVAVDFNYIHTNKEKYSTLVEECIKDSLKVGGDINPQDEFTGVTVLHLILDGLLDQRLLKYFSIFDIKNPDILITTVENKNLYGIQWLLDRGLNVNERGEFDTTPLDMSILAENPDPNIIQLLLDKGADANSAFQLMCKHIYENESVKFRIALLLLRAFYKKDIELDFTPIVLDFLVERDDEGKMNIDNICNQTEDEELKFIALHNLYYMLKKFSLSNEDEQAKEIGEYVLMKLSLLKSSKILTTEGMDIDSQLGDVLKDCGSDAKITEGNTDVFDFQLSRDYDEQPRNIDKFQSTLTPSLDHGMNLCGDSVYNSVGELL